MSQNLPIEIDCDVDNDAQFALIDTALGPVDDDLDIRIQAKLKADFHAHARRLKRNMNERIRELIALDTYGPEHVRSLLDQQLGVMGIGAAHTAPRDVPSGAPTSNPADQRVA